MSKPTYEELEKCVKELERVEADRKKAEGALRENEEKYRKLFETLSEGVFVIDQETGKILDVNKAATLIYGYSREEFLNMKNTDVSAEPDKTRKATHDVPDYIPVRYHKKKDGTIFPVEMAVSSYMFKGRKVVIATSHDITERKKAEEEIKELAKFPSENPNPVLRVTKDAKIIYANNASQPLLKFLGCQMNELLPDDWRKIIHDVCNSGLSENTEIEYEDKVLSLTFAPVLDTDYVNIYGLDTTDRKKLEEERIKASKLEGIHNLVVTVNHEMNQPLSVITSYSEHLIEELEKGSQAHEDAQMINDAAWTLAGLGKKIAELKEKSIDEIKLTDYTEFTKMIDLSSKRGEKNE